MANLRFRPCFPPSAMHEHAVSTRSSRLCITVPGVPVWAVDVRNPTGVTVSDVLNNNYAFFHTSVGREEYSSFPPHIQSTSADAFSRRTLQNPPERAFGMKRLDLVFPNVFVVGLTRAMDGSDRWDLRLAPTVG
jgi:hypothetical protein